VSELEGKTARVHVNRLKAVPDGREVDTSAPQQGLWPDVRCVGQEDSEGRCGVSGPEVWSDGFVWVGAEDLPDVVVSAYEISRGERAGTELGPDVV
jgi:hypothetical protein